MIDIEKGYKYKILEQKIDVNRNVYLILGLIIILFTLCSTWAEVFSNKRFIKSLFDTLTFISGLCFSKVVYDGVKSNDEYDKTWGDYKPSDKQFIKMEDKLIHNRVMKKKLGINEYEEYLIYNTKKIKMIFIEDVNTWDYNNDNEYVKMYEFYYYYILDNFDYTENQLKFMYKFFKSHIYNFVVKKKEAHNINKFEHCFITFIKFGNKCFYNLTMRNKISRFIIKLINTSNVIELKKYLYYMLALLYCENAKIEKLNMFFDLEVDHYFDRNELTSMVNDKEELNGYVMNKINENSVFNKHYF